MAIVPLWQVRCFQKETTSPQMEFRHEIKELKGQTPEELRRKQPHLQPYFEVMVFLGGRREITVGEQSYFCGPGDILFFNPEEPHYGFNPDDQHYDRFYLHIYPDALSSLIECPILLQCFTGRPYCKENRITIPEAEREMLFSYLYHAEEAFARSELLCGTYLLQFLIRLQDFLPKREVREDGNHPKLLQTVLAEIEKKSGEAPTVRDLSEQLGISRVGLWRLFQKYLGVSPQQYIRLRRLAHGKQLLRGGASVMEASIASGYGECSRFIAQFRASYGMTPLQYKKQYSSGIPDETNPNVR